MSVQGDDTTPAAGTQDDDGGPDPFTDGLLRSPAWDAGEDAFIVDVAGFEGPLDLLLAMARTQKVDLARISILALAEQYLGFIVELRSMRLELAADYLVMAAWLAYLKSRLLLPDQADDEEPSGAELAAQLAFRLQRLEAMREAAASLMTRNRLGRDVFARGAPEGIRLERRSEYTAELYDLLKAYAMQREKVALANYRIRPRPVVTLAEAREALQRLVGQISDWARLDACLAEFVLGQASRASAVASTFSASLELVREGRIEIRQDKAYAPIYMRSTGPRAVG
ncbi:MAG: ScpA family protein [Hyphomicrobiales bacterium]|nr:ScpA family protein [Hyphomicrobiales bacterium]